jgi:hypothetical protein
LHLLQPYLQSPLHLLQPYLPLQTSTY